MNCCKWNGRWKIEMFLLSERQREVRLCKIVMWSDNIKLGSRIMSHYYMKWTSKNKYEFSHKTKSNKEQYFYMSSNWEILFTLLLKELNIGYKNNFRMNYSTLICKISFWWYEPEKWTWWSMVIVLPSLIWIN